ncbi:hypothetical protein WA026_007790 [Henosepilachna vigintioctopunctata]|uniref:Uncharacterized protein n=1 Tax=Henosepilachna vigintioctopunctata TaxID=420089 RepID=A0AAW1TYP7_9CUCU
MPLEDEIVVENKRGKSMPMPSLPDSGLPPSALSYGPSSGLYPNLDPHFQQGPGGVAPFGAQPPHTGPHPGGIIPPNIPQSMPQPTNPSNYTDSAHKPFPSSGMAHVKIPGYPSNHNVLTNTIHLSEKDKKKIAKAEYKAEKKFYKAQRKAEKKAAKAERKAMKKHGIPTSAVVGAGVGAVGAATLAYAMTHHGRRDSCSSSSSKSSSSSSD